MGHADLLKPLGVLYAYTGRAADARAAIDRAQSIFDGFGAKLALAESGIPAGLVGLVIGDPVAGRAQRENGIRGHAAPWGGAERSSDLAGLSPTRCTDQGRFDEAQQMIDEANADASPDEPPPRG